MPYTRKGPFINVPNPRNRPAGAVDADAEYFNGVEDALVETTSAIEGRLSEGELSATYATKAELADSTALEPDPNYPGFYLIPAGSSVTEDPANPGYYLIGA